MGTAAKSLAWKQEVWGRLGTPPDHLLPRASLSLSPPRQTLWPSALTSGSPSYGWPLPDRFPHPQDPGLASAGKFEMCGCGAQHWGRSGTPLCPLCLGADGLRARGHTGMPSSVTTTPPLGAKAASRGSSSRTPLCALLTVVVPLCVMALQPPPVSPESIKTDRAMGQ